MDARDVEWVDEAVAHMSSSERFSYEWRIFNWIVPEYEMQFLKWVYPYTPKDFKNKSVLDAGCGIGRNSFWPLKYGARRVVAFDFDKKTVAVARKNLKPFSTASVIYNSIYNIDYANSFDIVMCIGVLHHLEFPKKALKNLIGAAKKGGTIILWVYGYEGNEWIVRYINPLRRVTSWMPLRLTYLISLIFTIPMYCYVKLFPQKQLYLKQLAVFKFWHIHSIIFDQLIPQIAHYWKKKEINAICEECGLTRLKLHRVNNNSWNVIGTK